MGSFFQIKKVEMIINKKSRRKINIQYDAKLIVSKGEISKIIKN
jgi:hypothetical protein